MKYLVSFFKQNKYLLLISVVFFIVRLFELDQTNLLHDERDIFLSGYSISQTGRDLTGKSFPFMFYDINPKNPLLAIYFNALVSFFIPIKSVFFARLIYVALTSALPILIFNFIHTITKNKKISYITVLMWCLSPWVFHTTRLGFEMNLAFIIFLIALNLYISGKRLWGYVFFALLTFVYAATRTLLPFALIFAEFWHFLHYRNWKRFISVVVLQLMFSIILLGLAAYIERDITIARAKDEIIFFNTTKIAPEVNFKRITSNAPTVIKKIMSNKLTVAADYITTTFILGIDSSHLFKKGDSSPINGSTASGEFLPVFLVFYYLGFLYLGKKLKKELLYPLGIIVVGIVPSLVNSLSPSFGVRAFISSVGFSYLITLGLIFGYELFKNWPKKLQAITMFIFVSAFFVSAFYFYYNFFERRFTLVSELFNEHERQLAHVLVEIKKPVIVYSENPKELFYSYFLFKKNMKVQDVQREIQKKNTTYNAHNVTFTSCPPIKTTSITKAAIFASDCFGEKNYEKLPLKTKEKVSLIPYHDISTRQAYYIFE